MTCACWNATSPNSPNVGRLEYAPDAGWPGVIGGDVAVGNSTDEFEIAPEGEASLLRRDLSPRKVRELLTQADDAVAAGDHAAAIEPLRGKQSTSGRARKAPATPNQRLADVHQKLEDSAAEREILQKYVVLVDDAQGALLRLLELEIAAERWDDALGHAEQLLGINPLRREPHDVRAQAAEATGDWNAAAESCQALLEFAPTDPAAAHYRLGPRIGER